MIDDRHGRSEREERSVHCRGVGVVGALLLQTHAERPERAVRRPVFRTVADAQSMFAVRRRPFESVRRRGRR